MGRQPVGAPPGRPPGRGVGGMDKSIPDGMLFIEYECYVTLNHLAQGLVGFDVSCLHGWMWLIHWIFHMKQVLVFLMHWFGLYAVICRLCNEKVGVIQIQCFLGSVACAC